MIVVLGFAGAVMVLVASLESAGGHKIETDKLLHFGGYFTLALLFVVGLSPTLYVVGILGLAGLGLLVELLQPLQGRSRDMSDMLANGIGITAGALLGLMIRMVLSWVRTELADKDERRRTEHFASGAVVFEQGEQSRDLYVVRRGRVKIVRRSAKGDQELEQAVEGDVVGEMGVIQEQPRYAAAIAMEDSDLYRVDVKQMRQVCEGEGPLSPLVRTLARRLRDTSARLEEREDA